LRFSRRWLWIIVSSGILRRVTLLRTDVSEELSASFIRVTSIGELGTMLAVTSNRSTLRRNTGFQLQLALFLVHRFLLPWWTRHYVPPKRRFLQEPHGVTSQKTGFILFTIVFLIITKILQINNLATCFGLLCDHRVHVLLQNCRNIFLIFYITLYFITPFTHQLRLFRMFSLSPFFLCGAYVKLFYVWPKICPCDVTPAVIIFVSVMLLSPLLCVARICPFDVTSAVSMYGLIFVPVMLLSPLLCVAPYWSLWCYFRRYYVWPQVCPCHVTPFLVCVALYLSLSCYSLLSMCAPIFVSVMLLSPLLYLSLWCYSRRCYVWPHIGPCDITPAVMCGPIFVSVVLLSPLLCVAPYLSLWCYSRPYFVWPHNCPCDVTPAVIMCGPVFVPLSCLLPLLLCIHLICDCFTKNEFRNKKLADGLCPKFNKRIFTKINMELSLMDVISMNPFLYN
jgi:hypothetical protein